MSEQHSDEYRERRQRQRFLARRDGVPCIWAEIDGSLLAVHDLSVEGFSVVTDTPPPTGTHLSYVLSLEGIPDRVRGAATVVNCTVTDQGSQVGYRFDGLNEQGEEAIKDWLAVIVICNASVRITAKEAAAIVSGPSLI